MAFRQKRDGTQNENILNKPLILTACALFVSVCGLAFTSYVKATLPESFTDDKFLGISAPCVKCEVLDDQAPNVRTLILGLMTVVEEDDKKKCCVQTQEELQTILQLVAATRSASDALTFVEFAHLTSKGILAHKRLHPGNNEGDETATMIPLSLTPEDDTGELSSNVLVTPHGIIILRTGLYRVYVSIRFRRGPDRPCGYTNITTWHYGVVRSRPNDRQQSGNILYAPHTCCKNCSTEHETSYTAGMFILQEGDHLHVEVSTPGLILFDKTSSFLGLHMMGEQGNG